MKKLFPKKHFLNLKTGWKKVYSKELRQGKNEKMNWVRRSKTIKMQVQKTKEKAENCF